MKSLKRFLTGLLVTSMLINSIDVISVYATEDTVLETRLTEVATNNFVIEPITPEMTSMPIYTYDNGNIIAEIFCSDTDFVVEDNGTIHTPLVDKEVLVTYLLKDLTTGKTEEVRNIPVIIPGKYQVAAGDNAAPVTVPSIQEWKGATGTFGLTAQSRIVVSDSDLQKAAEITKADISDLLGLELTIVDDTPQKGDIVLTRDGADKTIGDQGYTLDVAQYVTVSGATYQGVFFGTRSILQALEASGNMTIPKGMARDYSKYEHRKIMLDVARKYIPMWYLKDLVKYVSWYKFTDIQIHLNDATSNGYSAFRLESDIDGLTATDGYYTKDEYREFQYYAMDYGVTIISEIDTPAHSNVFVNINPDLALVKDNSDGTTSKDMSRLNIRLTGDNAAVAEKVYKFVEELYAEYMGGDDPVFVTEYFHVGLDEYSTVFKEAQVTYANFVMELVRSYGKTPIAWAGWAIADTANVKLSTSELDPIIDAWTCTKISFEEQFDHGYRLLNSSNKYGYIVPGGANDYPDFANGEEMYAELSAGRFMAKNGTVSEVAEGHPQIVGGAISLWNDRGMFNGISVYDIFTRIQSIVPIYAQTFWYGKDESISYDGFMENVNKVGAGANLIADKDIESESDLVYNFDMENTAVQNGQTIVYDISGNRYNAVAVNAEFASANEGQALKLNGDGYLQMQHTALKWPYTVLFDLRIDENHSGNINLFEETMPVEKWNDTSNIRKIYLEETTDGTYVLMYDRENYHFEHSVVLEKGQKYQLAFTSDEKYTSVYLDGKLQSTINGPVFASTVVSKWNDSASINLPLQKIGEGLVGTLDNVRVYNRLLEVEEISLLVGYIFEVTRENLALNKEASASSTYADKNGNIVSPPGEAVDGDDTYNVDSRWDSGVHTEARVRSHYEWFIVDLGDIYPIDEIYLQWFSRGVNYTVLGCTSYVESDNELTDAGWNLGGNWFEIESITNNSSNQNTINSFGTVEVRYIAINGTYCTINKSKPVGYSLCEIKVYESCKNALLEAIQQNQAKIATLSVGNNPGQIDMAAYTAYVFRLERIENDVLAASSISETEMLEYETTIRDAYTYLTQQIVKIDKSQLVMENVVFDNVSEGYIQPAAKPIVFTNNCTVTLTIPVITIIEGGSNFELEILSVPDGIGAGVTNDTSYSIKPIAGLAQGIYTATVQLTVDELVTPVTATVTFTVEKGSGGGAVTPPEHIHDYGATWKTDGTHHWHECACGDKKDIESHNGGTATCKAKAKCFVCDVEYGALADHKYGEATCGDRARCFVCNEENGELAAHTYVDGKCFCGATDPNYVLPHEHSFEAGKCECGMTDPGYTPEENDPKTPDENDGLSVGSIVAIVSASVVAIGGGGFCLFWFVFKKKLIR